MNQEQRVLQYLLTKDKLTTLIAMKILGVSRLSNILNKLRKHGYVIMSEYVTDYNQYGEPCKYKMYWLNEEESEGIYDYEM